MRDLPDLAHRHRLLGALAAWGILALASPGVLAVAGVPLLAAAGVGTWAFVEARPYRGRAWAGFLAHALGALPGAAALMLWIRFVYWPPLLYIGLGMGLYSAAGGVLLRRLLRAGPAALAPLLAGLAWTAMETVRAHVPMPLGLGWMRVGYHAHAWLPLAGSARVWGVTGLTLALASLGGLGALAVRARAAALRPAALAAGLGPALLGLALGALTAPPRLVAGPRVLVVQPGFTQERKQWDDPRESFVALREQTRRALADLRAAGEPEPDLVAWGESMLGFDVVTDEARAILAAAGDGDPAALAAAEALGGKAPDPEAVERYARTEDAWVRRELFGLGRPRGVLPAGTSFAGGAEVYLTRGGTLERWNGAVLYDAEGRRSEPAGKRYLVPGAETMYGLERIGAVRAFILEVAGYVPSFSAADRTVVLPLATRSGRRYGVATTVCFDNAHLAPYLDPVAEAPEGTDLHLVVSNEAWYRESFEVDQMIAFTRIAAIASGRTVVRATISGISAAIAPDGRELGRVVVDGRDRMVRGALALAVPVPEPGSGAPPAARLHRPLDAGLVLAAAALAALGGRRRRSAGAGVGNPRGDAG